MASVAVYPPAAVPSPRDPGAYNQLRTGFPRVARRSDDAFLGVLLRSRSSSDLANAEPCHIGNGVFRTPKLTPGELTSPSLDLVRRQVSEVSASPGILRMGQWP